MSSLLQNITTSKGGTPPALKKEVENLSSLATLDSLFSPTLIETNQLHEKSRNNLDKVIQGINESLEIEVNESRKTIESLKTQIRSLEREKTELLEICNTKNDSKSEFDGMVEFFETFLKERSNTSSENDSSSETCRSDVKMAKKLLCFFNANFNSLYENATIKTNHNNELTENISYLNEQLKSASTRSDWLDEENHVLKNKAEQTEMHYRSCLEDIDAMQVKLRRYEEEKCSLIEECDELRGEKMGINGHYNELDYQNEKLVEKLKSLANERDKLYNELHEQTSKTKHEVSQRKELEYNYGDLENTITRLKRDYASVTREMNMLTQENEDLKNSVQDSERDCMILKRNMKSVETNNKDLEDQLSHLTGQNQKSKNDFEKMKSSIQEYSAMLKELEHKSSTFERDKTNCESALKKIKIEKSDLEKNNSELNSKLTLKEELSGKEKIILTGYEKLIIKLLHQRKEIMIMVNNVHYKDNNNNYNTIKISSSQSLQYKLSSDIEESLRKNSSDIDNSFNTILTSLQSADEKWSSIEHYYQEIIDIMHVESDDIDKDSCYYSTDGEVVEPQSDQSKNNNHHSNVKFDNISKLVSDIKVIIKHSAVVDEKLTAMKHRSKRSIKIIRQLQLRIKQQKSLETTKRSRILYLTKRLKHSRTHHFTHHKNHIGHHSPLGHSPPIGHHSPDSTSPVQNHHTPLEQTYIILHELTEALTNTEVMITDAITSLHKPRDEPLTNEELETDFIKLKECIVTSREIIQNNLPDGSRLKKRLSSDGDCDATNKVGSLQEQREYLMDHVKFTNKRLEVLLGCWKDNDVLRTGSKMSLKDSNNNLSDSKNLLKRVRDSFKSDEDIMRRAVDVLELTKAISMTELNEISEEKAIDDEHLEVIVLIKRMNENVESILREARVQASEKNKSESTITLVGGSVENIIAEPAIERNKDATFSPSKISLSGGGDTIRRESKLKVVLESTQKRVNDLSEYLKQREDDLKERDEIIAKLYKEYEELKAKSNKEGKSEGDSTSDRIIVEYAKAKTRLEKENEFLQLVVREVREELLNLQKGCKKEEETEIHVQNLVDELQLSKLSLEQCLDKMASELNIVKRDKEYLMQSLQLAGIVNFYQDSCYGAPYSPAIGLRNSYHPPPHMYDTAFYPDCLYCTQNSESSVLPFSDDEWVSAVSCDDCDSAISEHDHTDQHSDVISSSESQTTTCSRLARNIKTVEASEKIKSNNRPMKYLLKETRTRSKLFMSPKKNGSVSVGVSSYDVPSNASDTSSVTNASLASKDSRVVGRRESSMRSRGSSLAGSPYLFPKSTTASITSQESGASSPCDSRMTDRLSLHESSSLAVEEDTWNEQDVSPFINPKFDGRKRKKKFLQFGKK